MSEILLMAASPDRVRQKWSWLILPLLGFCGLITIVGAFFIIEQVNRKPFVSKIWKQTGTPYAINSTRLEMVDDLMKSKVLEGKTKKEIIELLGNTDGDPAAQRRFPDWHLYYYLGPTKEFMGGFDYDYLVLRFDSQDKLVARKIVTLRT